MKTIGQVFGYAAFSMLVVLELSGCGSPPPPKSAKHEIEEAETAMEEGDSRMRRAEYDEAKTQFDKAMDAIARGMDIAGETETMRLENLRRELIGKRNDADINAHKKALAATTKPKSAPATAVAQADPDAEKRAAEKAKDAALAEANKGALSAIAAPKPARKVDEPEDTGDVAAIKAKKKDADGGDEKPAASAVKDDPTGVFPNVTADSKPFQIIKMQRIGKFVVAFCQVYNKTEDSKRITVANFFKDHDNQEMIPSRTTVSFPYEHFSLKVKDLIADQSVRNLTPDTEEIPGQKFLNFVSVGECTTEELAGKVAKVYIKVTYTDGTNFDDTYANNMVTPKIEPSLKLK